MEESAEVRAAAMRYFDAIANGDAGFMEQFISREPCVLLVGTDLNEWWPGYDKIVEIWRGQFEAVGGGFPIKPTEIEAYSEGSVGMFATRPVFSGPDGSEVPFRMTAVVHKEDGEWKLVMSHASFGIPNEEVVEEELPV
ncbi:MAG TPA: nuclear transport factor 2 family protein [Chloroflexia bacterium]